ncbi:hypothetical protein A2U01_0109982, partial [Trifolium medium]|nr:hypothetical protein [Trifolium medium]
SQDQDLSLSEKWLAKRVNSSSHCLPSGHLSLSEKWLA